MAPLEKPEALEALREPEKSSSDGVPEVELAAPLPSSIDVGRGSVLWLEGSQRSGDGRKKNFRITAGGRGEELLARGMPRPETTSTGDWWWAVMPVDRPDEQRELTIEIDSRVGFRRRSRRQIGSVSVSPGPEPGRQVSLALANPPLGSIMGFVELRPTVAICLPIRNPNLARFRHQFNSIRDQTYGDFRCVICDGGSNPAKVARIEKVISADDRFELHSSPRRLDAYGNVERALSLAPEIAPYVALAEQDDRWYPHKLELLLSAFETSTLMVHSDMLRVVEERAVPPDARDSERAGNRDCASFGALLLRNPVIGGACMFRRELLTYALPFPPAQGEARSDHWLSLIPRALGDVRFVDAPLYDRVEQVPRLDADDDLPSRNWRSNYFDHVSWGLVVGEVLRIRCWELMLPADRRDLTRFSRAMRAERLASSAVWLILRSRLSGQAGGVERLYLRGMVWRRVARFRGRFARDKEPTGHAAG